MAKKKSKNSSGKTRVAGDGKEGGTLRRAASSVARAFKRAVSGVLDKGSKKLHKAATAAAKREEKHKGKTAKKKDVRAQAKPRRVARTSSPVPDPDVPTPAQTSSHGPFDERSRRDPDKIMGGEKVLNEQFAEEDHYTNKSRDPRIGTRGRTYTP